MGKDQRLRYKKREEKDNIKMVYTHGKKKNAIANAVVARGTGVITVNRIPIQNIEPKTLRIKIFEPILLLGAEHFKDLRIKVRVSGGGPVAQLYAARMAISKGIVAWKQKYVDEEEKTTVRRTLVSYDKGLLVADPRRCEPKKYGGPGARARYQKSYR
jgi:small subunit ribosomal protein S16e